MMKLLINCQGHFFIFCNWRVVKLFAQKLHSTISYYLVCVRNYLERISTDKLNLQSNIDNLSEVLPGSALVEHSLQLIVNDLKSSSGYYAILYIALSVYN